MNAPWTEAELAYFAGIIDGEGCFCLHSYGTHRYASQLAVGNTDFRLLNWIRSRFGGTVITERRSNARHKPVGRWSAKASDLEVIVNAILPFLIVKRQQAELFLAYRATVAPVVTTKSSTYDTPESIKEMRHRIHAKLSALNRRGAAKSLQVN